LDASALVEGVLRGDVRAVARAITVVEDGGAQAAPLLAALFPHAGRAVVLGVTGPPGAGKSTLVDRITAHLRRAGKTVGIVAVDPTSPYSGGAILGDRIRMQAHAVDEGVFIRSMATRGHLGGLAAATGHVLTVLSASGKDVILVETVGVGQDEVEIVATADVSLVVLVPGLGDEVQALKAGIMEIADIFVVNKADRDGVERVVAEIQSMLSMGSHEAEPPAIVKTVATTDQGIAELMAAVDAFRSRAEATGVLQAKQRAHLRHQFEQTLQDRLMERLRARSLSPSVAARLLDRMSAREIDPFTAAEEVLRDLGLPGLEVSATAMKIDHLGIAVPDLSAAIAAYEALGFHVEATHDVPTEKVKTAFLPIGESHLELLEPTDPTSVIARFLQKRAGLHHVCVLVDDIEAAMAQMRARGVELLDQVPRVGAGGCRVAFIHPRSAGGVLLELKQA
jgi:LAO/AO transport system kinase